ncbi:unnamed protein product [marine sediment metagenome]|uniref:Uncharacterized protein n=1 Tax=marine sediment metagenome TaxID=412755 RepID=X1RBW4_9ZZZZ
MIYFLWLIFLLIIGKFFYILFWQKERPIPKQVVIKAKNGKTKIIIDNSKEASPV